MMMSVFDWIGSDLLAVLLCTFCSLMVGGSFGAIYFKLMKNSSKSFLTTLVLLPLIVQIVIMMVNDNLGVGVAVAGAFALVRFRSFQGSAKEITCLFFAMAIGLATGMGYLFFAILMTIVIGFVFMILLKTPLGKENANRRKLRFLVPENVDYSTVFEDIFSKYTSYCKLEKVKTADLGSVYELTYIIDLQDEVSIMEKLLIDEIRTRNGNLTVCSTTYDETSDNL